MSCVFQEIGPFQLGHQIWGIELFVASIYDPFSVHRISCDDLSFIFDIAICVFFPFFLVYLFFINLTDSFKESPFGFIDFL